jgi:hypothetical protein
MIELGPEIRTVDRVMDRLGIGDGQIDDELVRQFETHGAQPGNTPDYWFAITAEEVGEVAKALVERDADHAQVEIVHAIACFVRLAAVLAGGFAPGGASGT